MVHLDTEHSLSANGDDFHKYESFPMILDIKRFSRYFKIITNESTRKLIAKNSTKLN